MRTIISRSLTASAQRTAARALRLFNPPARACVSYARRSMFIPFLFATASVAFACHLPAEPGRLPRARSAALRTRTLPVGNSAAMLLQVIAGADQFGQMDGVKLRSSRTNMSGRETNISAPCPPISGEVFMVRTVDVDHPLSFCRRGRHTVNREPFPIREETEMVPPRWSAIVLQIESPRPAPCTKVSAL